MTDWFFEHNKRQAEIGILETENTKLKSLNNELLEALKDMVESYEVLKDIFEEKRPELWGVIDRVHMGKVSAHIKLIEKATGLTWAEIQEES